MSRGRLGIANIAAYKFVGLSAQQLPQLIEEIRQQCEDCCLKGTVLLSSEGINLFLAGPHENVDAFWTFLTAHPQFADMKHKLSFSEQQPFKRLVVKIKNEIIPLGIEGVKPATNGLTHLPPNQLRLWLDEGRDLTILDTRNDYEVKLGKFEGARDLNLQTFRDFPAAIEQLEPELKKKPLVLYCTGGIRCEKALPLLIQEGYRDVYQLDGGILNYFHQCGDRHFQGDCFVFDERIAVDSDLRKTGAVLCERCQFPVTPEQQRSTTFVPGHSCTHCFNQ